MLAANITYVRDVWRRLLKDSTKRFCEAIQYALVDNKPCTVFSEPHNVTQCSRYLWRDITLRRCCVTPQPKLFHGDYWKRKFLSISGMKRECFDEYNSLVIIGDLNGVSSRHERMSYNLKMTEIR